MTWWLWVLSGLVVAGMTFLQVGHLTHHGVVERRLAALERRHAEEDDELYRVVER